MKSLSGVVFTALLLTKSSSFPAILPSCLPVGLGRLYSPGLGMVPLPCFSGLLTQTRVTPSAFWVSSLQMAGHRTSQPPY